MKVLNEYQLHKKGGTFLVCEGKGPLKSIFNRSMGWVALIKALGEK